MRVLRRRRVAARRGLVLLGVGAAALLPVASASAAEWVRAANLKAARSEFALATAPNGTIYVMGGYDRTGFGTVTTSIYDPVSNRWRSGPRLPGVVDAGTAATGGDGRVYVFAARGAYVLDPGAGGWQATSLPPTHRWAAASATDTAGRIYVIGGQDDAGNSAANERFDPATGQWTTLASSPVARRYGTAVRGPDGLIYVFGGARDAPFQIFRRVDVYDPSTNTWSSRAPMPVGRAYTGAAVGKDGRIYLAGGYTDESPYGQATSSSVAFDPAANSWSSAPALSRVHTRLGLAVGARGRIFAISGVTGGNVPVKAVEGLRLG
jgi:N-acetylneuraminic acid mutarotase